MAETITISATKFKLMVSVITLLICAVAFTGAAYAYSSSVQSTQNEVTVDAEVLTLTGDSAAKTVAFGVDFKSSTVDDSDTVWTLDSAHSQLTDTFKISLASTTGVAKKVTLTVPASVTVASNTFTVGVTGTGVTGSAGTYTLTVTPGTDVTITVTLTAPDSITAPADVSTTSHKVTFTITAVTEDIEHTES